MCAFFCYNIFYLYISFPFFFIFFFFLFFQFTCFRRISWICYVPYVMFIKRKREKLNHKMCVIKIALFALSVTKSIFFLCNAKANTFAYTSTNTHKHSNINTLFCLIFGSCLYYLHYEQNVSMYCLFLFLLLFLQFFFFFSIWAVIVVFFWAVFKEVIS